MFESLSISESSEVGRVQLNSRVGPLLHEGPVLVQLGSAGFWSLDESERDETVVRNSQRPSFPIIQIDPRFFSCAHMREGEIALEHVAGLKELPNEIAIRVESSFSLGYYSSSGALLVTEPTSSGVGRIKEFSELSKYCSLATIEAMRVLKSGATLSIVAGPAALRVLFESLKGVPLRESDITVRCLSDKSPRNTYWSNCFRKANLRIFHLTVRKPRDLALNSQQEIGSASYLSDHLDRLVCDYLDKEDITLC